MSGTIGELDRVADGWKEETAARLSSAASLLEAVMGRFFLKTRMCLPFARKCEEAARMLDALLADVMAQPSSGAEQRLTAALDELEKATRTLDERSQMQGMAIT
jgi:hypothetical protein